VAVANAQEPMTNTDAPDLAAVFEVPAWLRDGWASSGAAS